MHTTQIGRLAAIAPSTISPSHGTPVQTRKSLAWLACLLLVINPAVSEEKLQSRGNPADLIFQNSFEGPFFSDDFEGPPTVCFSEIGNFVIVVGDTLSAQLTATSTDPASVLSFSKVSGPADLDIGTSSGALSWTPAASDLGSHTIIAAVSDQFGHQDRIEFLIEVVEAPDGGGLPNQAPQIQPINDQMISVGGSLQIQVIASDPELGTLVYDLLSAPSGMSIGATGLIDFVAGSDQAGLYSVAVRVRDPAGLAATAHFGLTVAAINQAPQAVDDGYEAVEQETLIAALPGVLINDSDPDQDPLTVSLQQDALFGSLSLNSNGSFSYTPDTPPLSPLGFVLKHNILSPSGGPNSTPRIGDVDADGVTDLVVRYGNGVAGANRMLVVRGDTGATVYHSPPYDRSVQVHSGTDILADIDLDGRLEMISVGGEGGRSSTQDGHKLVAMEHDGTFKWISDPLPEVGIFEGATVPQSSFGPSEIAVADLDQDGTPEIIVGTAQLGAATRIGVVVFDNQGKHLFTGYARDEDFGSLGSQSIEAYPEVVDLDLDGDLEILILSAAFSHAGAALWTVPNVTNNETRATPIAANLDNDPFPELVRASTSSSTMALNHDGSVLWDVPTEFAFDTLGVPIALGDVDDDGLSDVLLANNSFGPGFLQVLNGIDGSLKWQYPAMGEAGINFNKLAPTVFDLDRDGATEVVLFDSDRVIHLLNGSDGTLIDTYDFGLDSGSSIGFPIFADIDQDGASELVLAGSFEFGTGTSTVAWVFEGPNDDWKPAGSIWNQQNFHVTNINPDGSVPQFEQPHWLVPGLNQNRVNGLLPELRAEAYDEFHYRVSDGALTDDAIVYLTVRPGGHPQILSQPKQTATVGIAYAYAPTVTDPDAGETFLFALTTAPAGMSMDSDTGLIAWIPPATGTYQVGWSVTDSVGLVAVQTYSIEVGDPVQVPDVVGELMATAESVLDASNLQTGRITERFDPEFVVGSIASQSPPAGATAEFGGSVDLVVSLGTAPEDIDNDGDTFTENEGDCDDADNTIFPGANDPLGDGIDQNCDGIDGELALVSIVVEPATSVLLSGKRIAFTADGIRDDGTAFNLTGLGNWSNSDPNVVTFTPDGFARTLAAGMATISVEYQGVTGTAMVTVVGGVSADQTPPVALIDSPIDAMEITAPVEVIGTASDANLLRWDMSISRGQDEPRTLIATGTNTVNGGPLAELDPTMLMNGLYLLTLEVFDRGGNVTAASSTVEVDGDYKVGNFTLAQQDLSVALAGLPIDVVRKYDSRDKTQGDFGFGWQMVLDSASVSATRVLGSGWEVAGGGQSFALVPKGDHMVSVTLPDDTVETFRLQVTPSFNFLVPFSLLQAKFLPVGNAKGSLTTLDNANLIIVDAQPGVVQLLDDSTFDVFNPQRFSYVTQGGTEFVIDRELGLQSVTDIDGNSLTFTEAAITHSSGKSLTFSRDSLGRISQVTDPMGHSQNYNYDGLGNLARHVDAMGNVTTFRYARDHVLLEVMDPLGNRAVRTEYDASGRMISLTDAAGNRFEFTHDVDGREELITDPAGNIQRLLLDDDGNILIKESTVTIEGVPTVATETFEYDDRGNETAVVDADGVRTEYSYDADDNIIQTVVDPGGLAITTSATYNEFGQKLTETDALGHVYTNEYDDDGNLTRTIDPLGNETLYTHADNGQVLTKTDALGTVTTRQYQASGALTSEETIDISGFLVARTTYSVDANNNRTNKFEYRMVNGVLTAFNTQYFYDNANRLIQTIDPLGNVSSQTYNGVGQVATSTDANGHTTEFEYDETGRQTLVRFPDGSTTSKQYDARGSLIAETDELGRTTSYEYDELGRQVAVVHPDGAREETVYSPAGRELATIDALGRRTDLSYDSAGRAFRTTLPEVVDARDGSMVRPVIESTFNDAGQVVAQTDPNSNQTNTSYDALGRPTQTTFADGSSTSMTYDALNRIVSRTDELGQTVAYEYDARGNLLSVTEPAPTRGAGSKVTSYTWDLMGNRLTQTDALGRTTRYEYDALGRATKSVLPGGQFSTATFDPVGNLIERVDYNGDRATFVYDERNRLIQSNQADGSVETFGYLANGLRDQATGSEGIVSTTYDSRDRVLTVTQSTGMISYVYDLAGQQTAMSSPNQSVLYGYDAIGRLQTITDASGTTNYGYDPAGNKVLIERPNLSTSEMLFDTRNRTTHIEHRDAGDNLIDRYIYSYDDNGQRSSLTTADGTTETYVYDNLRRLVNATRIGNNPFNISYSYDLVGNRTSIDRDGVFESYVYDDNDRLLSAGTTTFTYDGNGNRTAMIADGDLTRYRWDGEGQLTNIDVNGLELATFRYDVDGNRTGVDRPGSSEQFLIDRLSRTGYPQIIEESDGDDLLTATHTYGADLLASTRGATEYPLVDGLGSTRVVIDDSTATMASTDYAPFGEVIAESGSSLNPYLFAGEREETAVGGYDLRSRFYDPSIGAFLGRDAFRGTLEVPVTQHPYLYAASDPVNSIDPSGNIDLVSLVQSIQIIATQIAIRAPTACSALTAAKNGERIAGLAVVGLNLAINAAFISSVSLTSGTIKLPPIPLPKSIKKYKSIGIGLNFTPDSRSYSLGFNKADEKNDTSPAIGISAEFKGDGPPKLSGSLSDSVTIPLVPVTYCGKVIGELNAGAEAKLGVGGTFGKGGGAAFVGELTGFVGLAIPKEGTVVDFKVSLFKVASSNNSGSFSLLGFPF
ncbi:MAG: hypothetical protein DHS20C11_21130 [Lysobacteraceae bacterium]|nr:MAG: hypothetical protein DHS20C11_21130 [Xanthomonadaceae bacterium]